MQAHYALENIWLMMPLSNCTYLFPGSAFNDIKSGIKLNIYFPIPICLYAPQK